MYSELLLDHFRHPRHVGSLESADASVEVSNPACGDLLQLSVRLVDGVVRDVRYQARGCTAAIACGSVLAEWMAGHTAAGVATLTAASIEQLAGGLPPASRHAAALCADAARALTQALAVARSR